MIKNNRALSLSKPQKRVLCPRVEWCPMSPPDWHSLLLSKLKNETETACVHTRETGRLESTVLL